MNSLFLNFIKRALLVPAVITAVVAFAIVSFVPKSVSASNVLTANTASDVDISQYSLVEFSDFSTLKQGDYVARIYSDELAINCAVVYGSNSGVDADCVAMQKCSTEPWNDGSVVIIGDNLTTYFRYLHNAVDGTEISVDFYRNSTYTYNITGVNYNVAQKNLSKFMQPNTLVLAVPYEDFESTNNQPLYIVYTATLGGVK
jgi:sortase (surface protein transpeptidase)